MAERMLCVKKEKASTAMHNTSHLHPSIVVLVLRVIPIQLVRAHDFETPTDTHPTISQALPNYLHALLL